MDELNNILEGLGFRAGDMPETWKTIFEGIHISICVHPLKGLALSFCSTGKRKVSEGEMFIPKNSTQSQIAEAILRIHEIVNK